MFRTPRATTLAFAAVLAGALPPAAHAQAPADEPSHAQVVSGRMKKGALFGALVGAGVGASIGYVTYFEHAADPHCATPSCPSDPSAPSGGQGAWTGGVIGVVVGGALGAILGKVTAPAGVDLHVTEAYVDPSSGSARLALRLNR